MTERTTVRLPDELLSVAKRKAAAERRTLTSLIEEGLRRVVSDGPQAARQAREMPPVSEAKGWLAPGIATLREAEEQQELEYVRKKLGL